MSDIVDKAVEVLMGLPKVDRDRIAWEIIDRVEDKNEWDRIVSSKASRRWLEKAATRALKEYEGIEKKLSRSLISLPSTEYLREDSYWSAFDDLPHDIQKLADANYKLWKQKPFHASLRFRQIHPSMPIFSFRVGLKHRTVGVQTPDDKLAWFWIGSFQQYQDLVKE